MSKLHTLELFTALTLSCLVTTGCSDGAYDDNSGTTADGRTVQDGQVSAGAAQVRDADKQILQTLHEKNLEEVAVGRMAETKGAAEAVRTFGKQLVEDHSRNNEKVKSLADELDVTLTAPKAKSPAEQALASLDGVEFDRRFASLMSEGHGSLVQRVEAAQNEVSNSQVKSLLAETLPGLRNHHMMAKELVGQIGAGNPAGASTGQAAQTPPIGGSGR